MAGRPFVFLSALAVVTALVLTPTALLAAAHIASHLVISEVHYDHAPAEVDNFVELYNPTGSAVDVTDWQIVGLDGTTGLEYLTVTLSGTIAAEGFFLIGQDASVYGMTPDVVNVSLNLQEGGTDGDGVKLKNDVGVLIDYIAYGGEGNPTIHLEGTPFRDIVFNRSIERKSSTTHIVAFGNGEDTDVNADDWWERMLPRPQNSSSDTEPPMPYQTDILTIYCFNIGHGDATLMISPSGGTFLFDGGENGAGNGKIVPFLEIMGIDTLTYMGASHYHSDHIGGLDEVVNAGIKLENGCWDRGWSYSTVTYQNYESAMSGQRHSFTKGRDFSLGDYTMIECLALNGNGELSQPYTDPPQTENDMSVALYLSYLAFQFFVGGDLSGVDNLTYTDIETSVAAEIPYPVEVYQVDHHGSVTSSNLALTNALQPQASVFSVGSGTGLPHSAPMQRLCGAGSALYFTNYDPGSADPIPGGCTGGDVEDDVQIATDGFNFFSVDTDIYTFLTDTAEPELATLPMSLRASHWPNPVREWTDIQLSGGSLMSPARVTIYDVAGRQVETLVDRSIGDGAGAMRWFVGDRPAGVYFYRVEAGAAVTTGKMVIVR